MRPIITALFLAAALSLSACQPPDEPVQTTQQALIGRNPFPGWETCINSTNDAVPLHYVRYWVRLLPGTGQDCFQVNLANRSPHSYHINYIKANVTNFVEYSSSPTWAQSGCIPFFGCTWYGSFSGQGSAFAYATPTQQVFDPSTLDSLVYVKALYGADSPL
jgi:hypothetical protein